jgi:hypothetical protein
MMMNTAASPSASLPLNIEAIIIRMKRIRFPKNVSKRYTNSPGTTNITNHKRSNKVTKPVRRFIFFLENMDSSDIIYNHYKKLYIIMKSETMNKVKLNAHN